MNDAITVEIIVGGAGIIGTCVSSVFAWLSSRRAKQARDEVTNQHPLNVRTDMDEKNATVISRFDKLDAGVELLNERIQGFGKRLDNHEIDTRTFRTETDGRLGRLETHAIS